MRFKAESIEDALRDPSPLERRQGDQTGAEQTHRNRLRNWGHVELSGERARNAPASDLCISNLKRSLTVDLGSERAIPVGQSPIQGIDNRPVSEQCHGGAGSRSRQDE